MKENSGFHLKIGEQTLIKHSIHITERTGTFIPLKVTQPISQQQIKLLNGSVLITARNKTSLLSALNGTRDFSHQTATTNSLQETIFISFMTVKWIKLLPNHKQVNVMEVPSTYQNSQLVPTLSEFSISTEPLPKERNKSGR